jgi:NAD-dependent dihydropyrimidine dehydrogenase PreA subunit
MSFIIGKSCVECVDTACVTVCPVDCINGPLYIDKLGEEVRTMTSEELKGKQLYIDPSMCINCGACIPECPVDAIYRDEDEAISNNDLESVHKNYEFYGLKYE